MSRERIEKLEALLARVERRRAEPRLVPVAQVQGLPTANTNLAEPMFEPPRGTAPIEAAVTQLALEPPSPRASSLPPPMASQPARRASSSPPVVGSEPAAVERFRAPTEVLPSVPAAPAARIVPSAPAAFDSAVEVVSSPRIDAPKTFGELLSQSLSLRPR